MINTIVKDTSIFSCISGGYEINVYGNVYNKEELFALRKYNSSFNIKNFALKLSGYFMVLIKSKKETIIINDIFGNYRLYYSYDINKKLLICSNEYAEVNSLVSHDFNKIERQYLERHRYTSGGECLNKNIKKVLPGSILYLKNGDLSHEIYFKSDDVPILGQDEYISKNHSLIESNIINNIDHDRKTILLFSGGVDSVYLSQILKNKKIDNHCIFIKYDYPDYDNLNDVAKVKKYEKLFNIKIDFIEYKISKISNSLNYMINSQPLDISAGVFYDILRRLESSYGSCNIINGQSSDSIYCWGNSSFTTGAFLQRIISSNIYFKSPGIFRILFSTLIKILYQDKKNLEEFSVPYKHDELLIGLLDPDGYLPTLSHDKDYQLYLYNIVNFIKSNLTSHKDIIFYFKLMYLQGPSNVPWINAARMYNHNLIMPFLDARIVTNKIKNQNEFKQLYFPRYELISYLCNECGIPNKYFKFKKHNPNQEEDDLINLHHKEITSFYKNYLEKVCDH